MKKNINPNTLVSATSEIEVLERHLQILKTIKENEPIEIMNLSKITGFPQHTVRYSIGRLEQDGLIKPSTSGAITTNRVYETLGTLDGMLERITTTLKDLTNRQVD